MTIKASEAKTQDEDRLPEIADDIENPDSGDVNINAGAEDYPDGDDADESAKPLSARELAVLQYRKLRDQQMGKSSDASDDDADDDADNDEPVDPEPAPAKSAAPAASDRTPPAPTKAEASPAKADPSVEATNALLEAARTLVAEVKSIRAAPAQPANDTAEDDEPTDPAGSPSAPALDEERLEQIVERIQIGDKAEGRQALSELIEIIGAGKKDTGLKADDVAQVVQTHIARDRVVGELSSAASTFRDKYASIVEDPDLLETSFRRLNAEIRDDLVKAGVPESDLVKANADQLMQMHQQARMGGKQVRAYGDIFDKVGADVTDKFKPLLKTDDTPSPQRTTQPKPAPAQTPATQQQRLDRKRQLGAQPRPASLRTQQSQPKVKTRAEVVAEMRRQRGFTA